MKLKIATIADSGILRPLVKKYHQFEGIEMSDEKRHKAITPLLSENALGKIWLIYHKNKVVGYAALCFGYSIEFAGQDAFIDEFYIEKFARGQSIGKLVLAAIKAEAEKLGISAIHLEVAKTNARAKKLYADLGFCARENFHLMSCKL